MLDFVFIENDKGTTLLPSSRGTMHSGKKSPGCKAPGEIEIETGIKKGWTYYPGHQVVPGM